MAKSKPSKKPEPKPTPPAADIVHDKSEILARDDIAAAPVLGMYTPEDIAACHACPICGTRTPLMVCPVDGHHFEVTK